LAVLIINCIAIRLGAQCFCLCVDRAEMVYCARS
jgi:hypothetical protein